MRSSSLRVILLLLLPLACEGGHTLSSPTIRVDLRSNLPARARRHLKLFETTLGCQQHLVLADGNARQRFLAAWRVFVDEGTRYVTAVEVAPEGETEGAASPEATATVGVPAFTTSAAGRVARVPLRIDWAAHRGCRTVSAQRSVELRADDPSCKAPPAVKGILRPVH